MRVAIDAMGSDHFPAPDVEGAVLAARQYQDEIILVGDEALLKQELGKHKTSGLKIDILHAPEYVTMQDTPSRVGKEKPRASMMIAAQLAADKHADAFITAGNTGAALAITTLYTLKRIRGVKRPTLLGLFPLPTGIVVVTDMGANADCRAEWLLQFAVMGAVYAEKIIGVKNPRVGLLSNGEEEGKGNHLIHEASELLKASRLNFGGNVEPKEVMQGGYEVVVCDGFVGNIYIKTMEALAQGLVDFIRQEIRQDWVSTLGAALARPAFRRVRQKTDPFEIGGAPLLGVNGVVIIGHGRTNATGIKNCIRQAHLADKENITDVIATRLELG